MGGREGERKEGNGDRKGQAASRVGPEPRSRPVSAETVSGLGEDSSLGWDRSAEVRVPSWGRPAASSLLKETDLGWSRQRGLLANHHPSPDTCSPREGVSPGPAPALLTSPCCPTQMTRQGHTEGWWKRPVAQPLGGPGQGCCLGQELAGVRGRTSLRACNSGSRTRDLPSAGCAFAVRSAKALSC